MKKLLAIVLIVGLCLGLAACGKKEEPTTPPPGTDPGQDDPGATDPEPSGVKLEYSRYINLSECQITIDVPTTTNRSVGAGILVQTTGKYLIILVPYKDSFAEKYEVNLKNIRGPEDVVEEMQHQLAWAAPHGLIRADKCWLEFKEGSKRRDKAGEWDVGIIEGKFFLEHKYPLEYDKARFIAYGIIKDDYPFCFAVIDISENQDYPIEELAHAMAATIRDYEDYWK